MMIDNMYISCGRNGLCALTPHSENIVKRGAYMVKKVLFIILWCLGIAATFPSFFLAVFMLPVSEPIVLFLYIFMGVYAALEILFPILFLVTKRRAFAIVSIVLFTLVLIPCVVFGGYSLYLVVTGQFHWC